MTNPALLAKRGTFTFQQEQRMLRPVDGKTVQIKQGNAYIPAVQVRAELSRTFGMGNWEADTTDLVPLWEERTMTKSSKAEAWTVGYRARVELRVRNYDGELVYCGSAWHVDSSVQPQRGDVHGKAITSAESFALRRAALPLGDIFGLHLYAKGNLNGVVGNTLFLIEHLIPEGLADGTLTRHPETGFIYPTPVKDHEPEEISTEGIDYGDGTGEAGEGGGDDDEPDVTAVNDAFAHDRDPNR
jgi:hypothetical protein